MSSASYWARRKAQEMFDYMAKAEDAADEISQAYLKASRYISLEMDQIFERFVRKHNLSEHEARRLLGMLRDPTSLDELKEALRAGDGIKAKILSELESPAYQARLERLQQLQNDLDRTMREVYRQEKARSTSHYVDLANEAYYRSIFGIQQRTGIGFSFNGIDPEAIDRVINSKWSGANYSSRIWNNTQALAKDVKEELLINLLTGRTEREVAEIIGNKFGQGASNARRLVRTESCNLVTQMDMVSYEECGIDTYIFVATLDLKTSRQCRELDGKRFKVSEQHPGTNCPPMHPWCRSTIICGISDEELAQMKRRARDPNTGKNKTVPGNMTYEQWYNQNVKDSSGAKVNENIIQNRSSDRKQYEKYKEILGSDAPETLDSFQKMKYTDSEKYGYTKLDYSRRKKLTDHPELKLPNAENVILPDGKFTEYLFDGKNQQGLAKGKAITERLGYDKGNWEEFQAELNERASKYPVTPKVKDEYGQRYEQKIVVYGKHEKPANMVVGWIHKPDGTVAMTSAYIKEVGK